MIITGDWISAPQAQAVCSMLTDQGYQALFVGGCVRNALLGFPINDIDISTDALPEMVMQLATAAGLRVIPTGIDHGTVTVIADGVAFEMTTFRHDVETDGRHARVMFSTDVAQDAARRDFTMNALYVRPDGMLIDPLGGFADLNRRHVRFINHPADRIREDYLRILRFFRFSTFYGDATRGFDADALDAIARNVDGLATLSRERVGSEMIKLLTAPDPAPAIATMRTIGVLSAILPNADDRALGPLIHFETELGLAPDPLRRLAVLGGQDAAAAFRLSKAQATRVTLLRDALGTMTKLGEMAYRHGKDTAWSIAALRAAMFETPPPPNAAADIDRGAAARFPITAADLMPDVQGAELGHALRRLETLWIGSDFALEKSALLADHRSQERR
jgi:poly(A) polymerase